MEDDPTAREALTTLLEVLGHSVCAVSTVAEGMERLDGQDRAILDLELPDGLGTHILHRIRDEGRPIRVAVVTGCADARLVWEAQEGGAELVLRKPLAIGTLLAWLDRDR